MNNITYHIHAYPYNTSTNVICRLPSETIKIELHGVLCHTIEEVKKYFIRQFRSYLSTPPQSIEEIKKLNRTIKKLLAYHHMTPHHVCILFYDNSTIYGDSYESTINALLWGDSIPTFVSGEGESVILSWGIGPIIKIPISSYPELLNEKPSQMEFRAHILRKLCATDLISLLPRHTSHVPRRISSLLSIIHHETRLDPKTFFTIIGLKGNRDHNPKMRHTLRELLVSHH